MNTPHAKLNPLTLLLCTVIGAGAAVLIQTTRSSIGHAPLSPPLSLAASLAVLAVTLTILALRLKKYLGEERADAVNPFHAVRLLAAARAAQFTGALCAGFGAGLIATLLTRITALSFLVWGPMLLTVLTAASLYVAGVYAEHVCRIPPVDSEDPDDPVTGETPAPDQI